jgi:hypothetical protein
MRKLLLAVLIVAVAALSVSASGIIKRRAAGPLASDNFNRANENPLSGGGNWSTPTGFNAMKIVSNVAVGQTNGVYAFSTWSGAPVDFPADQYSEVTIGSAGANNWICLVVRATDNTFYATQFTDGYHYFLKYTNGNQSVLGGPYGNNLDGISAGSVMRLSITGNTLTLMKDGVALPSNGSITDSVSPIGSGRPGIGTYVVSSGYYEDNWVGGQN